MRTRPAPSHRAPSDPLSDRWAFKPVAFVMLVATLIGSAGLLAVLISPPFLAAGEGVRQVQERLDKEGANFTRIPRLPQQPRGRAAQPDQPDRRPGRARDRGLAVLQPRSDRPPVRAAGGRGQHPRWELR